MEFLFLNYTVTWEGTILLVSLGMLAVFFSWDVYHWIRRKFISLNPRKAYTIENNTLPPRELPPSLEEAPSEEIVDTDATLEDTNTEGDDMLLGETPAENTEEEKEKDSTHSLEALPWETDPPWILPAEDTISSETDRDIIMSDTIGDIAVPTGPDIATWSEMIALWELASSDVNTVREIADIAPQIARSETDTPVPEKREELVEIVNNVKTLVARWHIDEARILLITWLAIQKNHRELNLIMASLYEREHAFEKAEFILKDIALVYPDDIEILSHLATVIAMQRKYEVAYELYKKILSLGGENEESLYTLTHLASELKNPEDTYTYAKAYLKQYPKNPEILWLYSQAQIAQGERKWAVETLIKLKNLTPYNQEIVDLIGKLVTEEELAGNFGEEKNA
jgi:Tfp pilus assembly protein PilF